MNEKNNMDELLKLIKGQNFTGTDEEIAIQQILFLDKYIKEHVDYGFSAVNDLILAEQEYKIKNSEESLSKLKNAQRNLAFTEQGFWNGVAVCGSISSIAKKVLNELGIKCDYVWGFINGVGHRWNIVTINNKDYMVDFTLNMVAYNYNKSGYEKARELIEKPKNELEYLFFDSLLQNQVIGGFIIDKEGHHIENRNELGIPKNTISNPRELYRNLHTIDFNEKNRLLNKLKEKTISKIDKYKILKYELLKYKNNNINKTEQQLKNNKKTNSKVLRKMINNNNSYLKNGFTNVILLSIIVGIFIICVFFLILVIYKHS